MQWVWTEAIKWASSFSQETEGQLGTILTFYCCCFFLSNHFMLYAAKPVTQRSSNLFCVNVSGDTIYSLSTIFGYRFIFSFLFYLLWYFTGSLYCINTSIDYTFSSFWTIPCPGPYYSVKKWNWFIFPKANKNTTLCKVMSIKQGKVCLHQ